MERQITGVTLAFLMQGFNFIDKDGVVLDGMGEDDFFHSCYPLAEAIVSLNESIEKDRCCPGIYMYEAIEDFAAKVLFDYVKLNERVPEILEFIDQFKPKLISWYNCEDQ